MPELCSTKKNRYMCVQVCVCTCGGLMVPFFQIHMLVSYLKSLRMCSYLDGL